VNLLAGFDPAILLLIIPLVVIELGLLVFAIYDLLKQDRHVRGGSKAMWAIIIVFVNGVGPLIYLLIGRVDAPADEPHWPGQPGWGSPHDPPVAGTAPIVDDPAAPTAAASPVTAITPAGPVPQADTLAVDLGAAVVPADATPPGPAAIGIHALTKRYKGGVLALDALHLAIPERSVFGLLGPNGAGKTTTLRILAGLTRPTGGRADVAGIAVADDPLGVRRHLGFLEQDPRAYGWMTGREQLMMLGRLHGLEGAALDRAVTDALARVDLSDAADRRTGTYSGGMRQRLGIAGALVHRPPVLVLDEPVSALDPEGRRDVLGLIASLRGEATVLFSTHVLADVERICDRVAILDHGRLVVEGSLASLLERYALPVFRVEAEPGEGVALERLAARLRDLPWVTGVGIEHGLLTVAVADPAVAARELLPAITGAEVPVVSVARARPTLEDVFLRLTGDGREAAA
jgi:ABC-2 type transport system ATP-binding protein